MLDDDGTPATKPEDIVLEAKKRFEMAKEAYSSSRSLAIADTQFAMGDSDNMYQWPQEVANERAAGKRVCLTVNATAQHCNQVLNAIRQNRPACKVTPSDNLAHKEAANVLAGMIRQIQRQSSADDAHDTAAEHATYGGEGFWRVATDWDGPDSFAQVIKILPVPNPQLVFIDPTCKLIDKSDAEWGFVFEDITLEQCKREHPNIDPMSWGNEAAKTGWADKTTVRRAEYFYSTYEADYAVLLHDGSTTLASKGIPAGAIEVKRRPTQVRKWKWCKLLGGEDKPIDTTDWPGQYLPIVSVVGKELNVNGEIIRKGLVRDIKDPQRMLNYAYSETVQSLALQNKIPYLAAAESISGYEDIWKSANTDNRAYLPYNALDDEGNALPRPERQPPPVLPAAQIQLLQLSTEEMRAASGQQNSNFGIKSEASSGIGIRRLQAQGELATFHFPDNLARALRYEAMILVDLIPKIYDTEQVVQIIGLDGKDEQALLSPNLQSAYSETTMEDVKHIFNPLIGKYGVVVDTGPAYATQRQEAADRLGDLANHNPAMMQIAGDLIMGSQDWPMADKLAERFRKALPPGLQDKPDGEPDIPPEVQQHLQQADQMAQLAAQHIDDLTKQLEEAKSQEATAMAEIQGKDQREMLALEAKYQRELADLQHKRDLALADIELQRTKFAADLEWQKEKTQMELNAQRDIEEMKGYFDLQKAQMQAPSPALTADVEGDFNDDQNEGAE